MKTIILIANLFVNVATMDGDKHVYLMKALAGGTEYLIAYTGDDLGLKEGDKVFKRVSMECEDVQLISGVGIREARVRLCNALKIEE